MAEFEQSETALQDWLDTTIQRWGPVEARAMFGAQAYLVGGKMFAALGTMGLLLKLPAHVREPLLLNGAGRALHGRPPGLFR